jgi:deoxyribonuclease V
VKVEAFLRAQERKAKKARLYDAFGKVRTVAGADCSYFEDKIIGGVVTLDYETLEPLDRASVVLKLSFPYIPGLLAYREAPAMIGAFRRLASDVDVLMIDGFGINHPRRCGIATEIGLKLDMPTIGVGKSFLCGDISDGYIFQNGERTGKLIYSGVYKRPVYVSPGHKITLDTAVEIVTHCIRSGRIPEPTRLAHEYVTALKQGTI